jgi:hypothetical protein
VPNDDPTATMQLLPGQQSALTVQVAHAAWQVVFAQMNCGPASPAFGLGTHGTSLQQSALETQAPPAGTQVELVQRGTPTSSGLHVSLWQLPLQQSHDALHDCVARRHTSPFGLHESGLRHTPREAPAAMLQAPGWL